MTTTYSEESIDALSWLMSASVHYFMDYGGYFPTSATAIFQDMIAIEDAAFVETLSGDLGREPNVLCSFCILEQPLSKLESYDQLLSQVETASFIFSLVSTRYDGFEAMPTRAIYISIK